MGTTKAGEQNVRVLQKTNTGSYTLSIPIELIRAMKWQSGQKLTVESGDKTLVIRDWQQ